MVQTVIFRPIPDVSTRISELATGGIQIMEDLPPDQAAQVKAAGDQACISPTPIRWRSG